MNVRIKNIFEPSIIAVDLSDKELDYITALVSGVGQERALNTIQLTPEELEKLYFKFGLSDTTKLREVQIATITSMSNFVTKDICSRVADKYGFTECLKFGESV